MCGNTDLFCSSLNLRLNAPAKYIVWYFNSRTGSDLAKAVEEQIHKIMLSKKDTFPL